MRSSSAVIQAVQILTVVTAIVGTNGVTFPPQTNLENNTLYDYIVIGAGTAGCVVATRLVEDLKYTVLLLEAGGDTPRNAVLAGKFNTLPKTEVDYNYSSTYDPYAARSQGDYTTLTAGKMLGGCASLNFCIHTRGCPLDFDYWAEISGDDSWRYFNVLKYFIKSERTDDEEIYSRYPQYHGKDGPMGLTRDLSDETADYMQAFNELGYPIILDLNSPETPTGYTQYQNMIADGLRQTPAVSYLSKVADNPNLYLSKNTRVIKILFEGTVATGVLAVYNNEIYTLYAKKEVILCAGAFNSPQLLMLSGIGPRDHLTSLGIGCIYDLPVGDGYTDHIATVLVYVTKKYLLHVANVLKASHDPAKIPFPVFTGAISLNNTQICPDYHDYNLILAHDTPLLDGACRKTFWYRDDICDRLTKEAVGRDVILTFLINVNPKSKGVIRLRSANPFDDPLIETGFLKDEEDLENMVDFVMNHIRVLKTKHHVDLEADLIGLDLPECLNEVRYSREFWRCYIKNMDVTPYHYMSSCAICKVVNNNLQVYGFDNLWVIDASVMPSPPRAPPNAAVVMIAEKGVDVIRSKA